MYVDIQIVQMSKPHIYSISTLYQGLAHITHVLHNFLNKRKLEIVFCVYVCSCNC
jgi:hypothetical protein